MRKEALQIVWDYKIYAYNACYSFKVGLSEKFKFSLYLLYSPMNAIHL